MGKIKHYTYRQAYGICYRHKYELGFKLPEWGDKYLRFYIYPNLEKALYKALKKVNLRLPKTEDDLNDLQLITFFKMVNSLREDIEVFNTFLYQHGEYSNLVYTPSKEDIKRKDWIIIKI